MSEDRNVNVTLTRKKPKGNKPEVKEWSRQLRWRALNAPLTLT